MYYVFITSEAQMWELTEIVVPRVMAKWESLAYCMRYTPEEVSAFNKDGKDSKECCTKLLTNWLTTGHEPKPKTYQILLKYIKKISDLAAASEAIEKELIKSKQIIMHTYCLIVFILKICSYYNIIHAALQDD